MKNNINDIKKALGLTKCRMDLSRPKPQSDTDMCYTHQGILSYSDLKAKGISENDIYKVKTLQEYRRDTNYYFTNLTKSNQYGKHQ